jgi:serine/threonine protein phosphatase 1
MPGPATTLVDDHMMTLPTEIDGTVAVIGDVHGQVEEVADILDQLRDSPDFEERWVVFIGDLVDRGPDPKRAIEQFLAFQEQHPRTTAISGNHEFAMAAALELIPTPEYSDWAQRWCDHYGAEETFASYGADFGDLDALYEALPQAHRDWLVGLPWIVEHPEYLFVHAGLDPNQPLAMQRAVLQERDFSLTRPPWLCSKSFVDAGVPDDCLQTVVSGHVPVPAVHFGDRRILIDTTGGVEGELSCVLLPEQIVITSGYSAPPEPTRPQPRKKTGLFGFLR